MANVGIVTDSIACLPPEIIKEYDIRTIPVALNINGKPYRDGVDIEPEGFWKMFDDVKEFTTGAPALSEYTEILSDLAKTSDGIVGIFVSKALSAISEAAIQAADLMKQENPDLNIEIVDSRTAAGAQGFLVEEAAKAAKEGKSVSEVVQIVKDTIPRVKFTTAMETLKYLIKSGRAPKTAYMGELFQVKPIIGMLNNTGEVENLGRARGWEKAQTKLLDIIAENIGSSEDTRFNVHYTNSIEDGEKLKQMVIDRFNPSDIYFTPYTPVMAGHTGPVMAVSFYHQ
ncbi:MAG: DegV family protein [Dehalococcoidales bacterium]|nr:MAG: DegV family protein [Dehalococcoidales bacterium]